jgi:hypothetical protein
VSYLRRIRTKYEGVCKYCRGIVRVGEVVYWEQGNGIWHTNCAKGKVADRTQLARSDRHMSRRRTKLGLWQLIMSLGLLVIFAGLVSNIIAARTVTYSPSSIVGSRTYSSTMTSLSPVSTSSITLRTTKYSTRSYPAGYPSCPYGGTYYASVCTSYCGCQYDVCVSFDYNCANDYHAIQTYLYNTVTLATITTSVSTHCTSLRESVVSTKTFTAYTTYTKYGNPSLAGMSYDAVAIGAVILLSGALLRWKKKPRASN